jgi:drug/metabolite transporter (DMT)-like permease
MSLRSKINSVLSHSPTLSIIAAFAGAGLINLAPLFVRFSEVGPITTAFYRFFFALPIIGTLMIFDHLQSKEPRLPRSGGEYAILMLGGALLALDIIFWHLSIIKTTVMNSALLSNMTPVIVAFASWFFFREKITLPLVLGIALALFGSFILVGGDFEFQNEHLEGDLYGICSAVLYGSFIVCVKELRRIFSPATIMFWVTLSGMYVLALSAIFMNEVLLPQTLEGWGILVGLALTVHILGAWLLTYSMGLLSATFSSLANLMGPGVAALIGWFVFHEALTFWQGLGAIIVLAGILLSRQVRLGFSKKINKK